MSVRPSFTTATGVEHDCLNYVLSNATRGSAESVVNTLDEFGYKNWLMAVGDIKGAIVDNEIRAHAPKIMAEIGGYCGYSAVRFGALQRAVAGNDSHYYAFEYSPEFAAIANQIISFAGLADHITIVVGSFSDKFPILRKSHGDGCLDLLFIDHAKELYLADLKAVEESGLLHKGSVIVADNVIYPGAPDYLDYIRANRSFTSKHYPTVLEYMKKDQIPIKDGVEVSVYTGN